MNIDRYKAHRITEFICIADGLHAVSDLEYAKKLSISMGRVLFECTIPAGSEYYEGPTGLIVSNKLIVTKQVNIYEQNETK